MHLFFIYFLLIYLQDLYGAYILMYGLNIVCFLIYSIKKYIYTNIYDFIFFDKGLTYMLKW